MQQQEQPEQRLARLQQQLSHSELLKQLTEHQGYAELIKTLSSEVSRRRKGANAINWESKAEEFNAFEKRSLYAAGYIQGAEFALNVLLAIPQQQANLEQEIATVEAQIKEAKKRRR